MNKGYVLQLQSNAKEPRYLQAWRRDGTIELCRSIENAVCLSQLAAAQRLAMTVNETPQAMEKSLAFFATPVS